MAAKFDVFGVFVDRDHDKLPTLYWLRKLKLKYKSGSNLLIQARALLLRRLYLIVSRYD